MKKQFLVALHVQSVTQVFAQAELLLDKGGADGVLLVNNGGRVLSQKYSVPNLFEITKKIKEKYPNFVVGINPLDLCSLEALEFATEYGIDVLWVDNGGVQEKNGEAYISQELIIAIKNYPGEYWGGTFFKGQPIPHSLKSVCHIAREHFTAVITSGPETGVPPRTNKILSIREHLGKTTTLGIASGLTAGNLSHYYEQTDIFIVGTSLQKDPSDMYLYDVGKVRDFKKAMNTCKKQLEVIS